MILHSYPEKEFDLLRQYGQIDSALRTTETDQQHLNLVRVVMNQKYQSCRGSMLEKCRYSP